LLIITGGIDLSMGSVVGLCATVLAMLLGGYAWPWPLSRVMEMLGLDHPWHPLAAITAVLLLGVAIGLINGLMVTRLRVQAFIVTLCGLFIYRGVARWVAGDEQRGLGNKFPELKRVLNGDLLSLVSGDAWYGLPLVLVIFAVLVVAAVVFLHLSIFGRYLYAIGSNERAARYSGIATGRYKLLAYVLCSGLTAFFGVLYLMKYNTAQPSSTGNFFELYAIAGAVLGGCSLRGGEGTVPGIVIGTSILWILPNLTNMLGVPSALEYTVIGFALLLGAILDELLRPRTAARATG